MGRLRSGGYAACGFTCCIWLAARLAAPHSSPALMAPACRPHPDCLQAGLQNGKQSGVQADRPLEIGKTGNCRQPDSNPVKAWSPPSITVWRAPASLAIPLRRPALRRRSGSATSSAADG